MALDEAKLLFRKARCYKGSHNLASARLLLFVFFASIVALSLAPWFALACHDCGAVGSDLQNSRFSGCPTGSTPTHLCPGAMGVVGAVGFLALGIASMAWAIHGIRIYDRNSQP